MPTPADRDDVLTVVLSGPGGVGKGTVVKRLVQKMDRLWLSQSWTSRKRRPGEPDDAYRFVTRAAFDGHIEAGGFIEWIDFLDYRQGTPVAMPPKGYDVLYEIDVQGAERIRSIEPAAFLIFIDAPSVDEQRRRLRERGDSESRVAQRIEASVLERSKARELGCIMMINDDVESTVAELSNLIIAARAANSQRTDTN